MSDRDLESEVTAPKLDELMLELYRFERYTDWLTEQGFAPRSTRSANGRLRFIRLGNGTVLTLAIAGPSMPSQGLHPTDPT